MKCTSQLIKPIGLFVLLCLLPLASFAQNITARGVVSDDMGPIVGASVVEKGTSNGMVTNLNGEFSLDVKRGATLVISYIGYITQEVTVNSPSPLKIKLKEDSQALEEVVVIGYGTARRSDVTGSVSSVKGSELRAVQTGNISSALQGRVAGVEMSQTSSQPGASMQIRIRGTRSLNADNDPLIVLDGIPFAGSISDINPNDIKSMDILKDASSTAIYGSRGANGVLMITTNKGYTEQKAQISYNAYFGLKTLFARYPMMDGPDYVKLRSYAGMYTNGADEDDDYDIDWQDKFYRTPSITTSHDIGITGGGKSNAYSFGLGYFHDEGVIPTQQFTRYSARASLDQQIGKYIKVGIVSNTTYHKTEGSQISMYGVLSLSPIANPYNDDGSLKRTVVMPADEQYVWTKDVLEGLGESYVSEQKAFASYNSFYAEVTQPWIKGLSYRINIGMNYRHTDSGSYTGTGVGSSTASTISSASSSSSTTTNWEIENLLTYDRIFKEKHHLNVVGLFSAERTTYDKSAISATGIPADYFQYHNLGLATGEITVSPSSQVYQQTGLLSWMARAMYTYDDRYMISAAFRSDGSSRLAEGHKWHAYPAVSAGWNIANEAFFEKYSDTVDELKFRVGYGQTSNQAIDPYKTLGTLSTVAYNFGDSYTTGYYVSELANHELGWEYSSTWNFGLDFSLFKGRLSGTVEYYIQKTNDLLVSVNLPSTAGVGSYMANVGNTQNKGFELSLNGTIIDNKNGWTWTAGINLYTNRNKITSLASGQTEDESNWWFVGHPIDVVYDYEKIGLWNTDDPDYEYFDTLEPGGNLGMIRVKYTGDRDSDGAPTRSIGSDDRQIISLEPNFQGGFNTMVAYKDWDLSIVGSFKNGGKLISTLYSSSGYLNMENGRRGQVEIDYWTEDNTDAKFPKPGGITSSDNPKYGSSLGLFSASYLKIRTITLGYNVPRAALAKVGINSLRIYATVQNPFVFFSPYKRQSGMDPETNAYGDEHQAVTTSYQSRLLIVGTNAPNTRNYLIGLNLTF